MSTVGRGWLTGGGTNDWLVIGVQTSAFKIPEPGSVAIAMFGLLSAALAYGRLRRR